MLIVVEEIEIPKSEEELKFLAWISYIKDCLNYFHSILFQEAPQLKRAKPNNIRKNYADSTTGASILYASPSIINKKAILDQLKETYMQLH